MKRLRLLLVTEEKWYVDIVHELRNRHEVDYVFIDAALEIKAGDFHVPRLFGRHLGFRILSSLLASFLLIVRRYDVCLTDYRSVYRPLIVLLLRGIGCFRKTIFIHDLRTMPVEYDSHLAASIDRKVKREMNFAGRFYQGISFITDEMRRIVESKLGKFPIPSCSWGSGVLESLFRPLPVDVGLRSRLGFTVDDFVVFYHGSFGLKRGVIELVESLPLVERECRDIRLVLLGSGAAEKRIRDLVSILNLNEVVVVHEPVDITEVPSWISIADLCVVPLPDIDWWRVSSPLKLMEYIASARPVLLSDIVAHTNVVGKSGNFFWIENVDAESIAGSLLQAHDCFRSDPIGYQRRAATEWDRLHEQITWRSRLAGLEQFMAALQNKAS